MPRSDRHNDQLDDKELMERENSDHDAFRQLEREEPRTGETTYGRPRSSSRLVAAWELWWSTNAAARARGLITRALGR